MRKATELERLAIGVCEAALLDLAEDEYDADLEAYGDPDGIEAYVVLDTGTALRVTIAEILPEMIPSEAREHQRKAL